MTDLPPAPPPAAPAPSRAPLLTNNGLMICGAVVTVIASLVAMVYGADPKDVALFASPVIVFCTTGYRP